MEFTEITEIDDMITYSRSFRPNLVPRAKPPNIEDDFLSQEVKYFTYEDLLNASFNSLNDEDKGEKITKIINLDYKKNQTLEEILEDITNFLNSGIQVQKFKTNDPFNEEMKNSVDIQLEKPNNGELENIIEELNGAEQDKEDEKKVENSDEKNYLKNNTYCDNVDSKKKKIERLEDEHISQTFTERKMTKSLLVRLSSKGGNSDQGRNTYSNRITGPESKFSKNSKKKTIKAKKKKKNILFKNNKDLKVAEVIRCIIEFYMNDSTIDISLMKYPNQPEAYQLRILDDDDYKPELAFEPLDPERKLSSYDSDFLDCLAFCDNPNFKPMQVISADIENDKKIKLQTIMKPKNKNVLQVAIPEESYTTMIPLDPENLLKDIFPIIQKRIKINPLKYTVHAELSIDSDFDILNEDEELDINMPLKNLKTNKIKLKKKVFADDPNINQVFEPIEEELFDPKSMERSEGIDHTSILMNEVQACKYEEFEVIKINNRGKRQVRILGIDQFKVYNRTKEKDVGIYNLINIFGNGAKNPERLIETVKDLQLIQGSQTQFFIQCLEENNKLKKLTFEAKDVKIASYIFAKLNYLMNLKNKVKRMKKASC